MMAHDRRPLWKGHPPVGTPWPGPVGGPLCLRLAGAVGYLGPQAIFLRERRGGGPASAAGSPPP